MQQLSSLPRGSGGQVREVLLRGTLRDRLRELGLVPGCRIRCVDGTAGALVLAVQGTVFALRRRDAAHILVEVDRWTHIP